ncbi:hypothetical protein ACIOD1_05380 [Streptomyces sp. NPDC088097]|uniref:hypothetical protein n=1 Tax=Streptomyces sp. NPDC088097 TaxID=3365823 RepID=UPI00382B0609
MHEPYAIEVEPEVRTWLELLPDRQYRKVEEYADLLATHGPSPPCRSPVPSGMGCTS